MCKSISEGGQRCHAHAVTALRNAKKAHEAHPSFRTEQAVREAEIDLASTGMGRAAYDTEMRAYRDTGRDADADRIERLIRDGDARRDRNNDIAREVARARAAATFGPGYDPTGNAPDDIDTHYADLLHDKARIDHEIEALSAQRRPSSGTAAKIGALVAQQDHVTAQIGRVEQEWSARGGWTRAWLVTGGHAHRSTSCSSCYPTTQYSLVTSLSGKSENEIVDAAANRACTVCYPSAPVAARNRQSVLLTPEERTQHEQREAAATRRQTAAATAATKAITAPDGTPLRDPDNRPVKTEIAAEREAVRVLANSLWYRRTSPGATSLTDGRPHPTEPDWQAYATRATEALAAKRGVPDTDVAATLKAKADKKYRAMCKEAGIQP